MAKFFFFPEINSHPRQLGYKAQVRWQNRVMALKLGEFLVQRGYVSPEKVMTCLDIQKKEGGTLGIIMLNLGYISETQLAEAVRGIPLVTK